MIGVRDLPLRYAVPGCVEDGAWMIWENSSAAAVVAHLGWVGGRGGGKFEGACPLKILRGVW